MKIVQINTFPYKATGNIMMEIHKSLLANGHDSYVVWGRGREAENPCEIVMKDEVGIRLHGIYTRITDKTGFASVRVTKKLLLELDRIHPDIIHLHNVHGYYLNIDLLFRYIKSNSIKVVWTLHDCWPITGHCAYFDKIECKRWKTGCYSCPQKDTYPASWFLDNSKWNWKKKKMLFTDQKINIVTPCNWLKMVLKESFLNKCPLNVIYNGIDINIFKPTAETNIFSKYHLEEKKIILGVASEWTERKGLKDFIKLATLLDQKQYQIILIGLTKQQIEELPKFIIGIERTSNVQQLASIYTRAYYFFNPTYEDNFPMTNLESIACGTPVITYKTGGSPESLNQNCGIAFEKGDVFAVADYISKNEDKMKAKLDMKFNKNYMIRKYLDLYEKIIHQDK